MSELRISAEVQAKLEAQAQAFQVSSSEMLNILCNHFAFWDDCLLQGPATDLLPAVERVCERHAALLEQGADLE